ncbi:lasso peptide biosynthesis B2 protein [candidate division KSB1 bacterium]|nr:lasso peptide biosynthesis B2 protein [candidate division KSB1 bacterium]
MVRFRNITRVLQLLSSKKYIGAPLSKHEIYKLVSYVDFILNLINPILKKTCLKRSLVLYRFLRYYNSSVDFKIGVQNKQANILGHSWLILNGKIFADTENKVKDFKLIYNYTNYSY